MLAMFVLAKLCFVASFSFICKYIGGKLLFLVLSYIFFF